LGNKIAIEQIKVGFDNFSYVIYSNKNKEAVIVDPSFDASDALKFIWKNSLILKYVITTHYHSDHSGDIKRIKKEIPLVKLIASEIDGKKLYEKMDIFATDNLELNLGEIELRFITTPGHTPGGICILVNNEALLTGDTLFIGDCGRTDLPGGNLKDMFTSLHEKIMSLPDSLIIYPGHDYGEKPFDTLGNQKKTNKTLKARNLEEFSKIP